LGNGIAMLSRLVLFRYVQGVKGVAVHMTQPLYAGPTLTMLEPQFFLQNLPSIVTGHVLRPQPGMRVLDMCAAPGGKTSHLADLVGPAGCVIALERSGKRVSGRCISHSPPPPPPFPGPGPTVGSLYCQMRARRHCASSPRRCCQMPQARQTHRLCPGRSQL
jgi:hypothetical protein